MMLETDERGGEDKARKRKGAVKGDRKIGKGRKRNEGGEMGMEERKAERGRGSDDGGKGGEEDDRKRQRKVKAEMKTC